MAALCTQEHQDHFNVGRQGVIVSDRDSNMLLVGFNSSKTETYNDRNYTATHTHMQQSVHLSALRQVLV
jgi:hypothetical protein